MSYPKHYAISEAQIANMRDILKSIKDLIDSFLFQLSLLERQQEIEAVRIE